MLLSPIFQNYSTKLCRNRGKDGQIVVIQKNLPDGFFRQVGLAFCANSIFIGVFEVLRFKSFYCNKLFWKSIQAQEKNSTKIKFESLITTNLHTETKVYFCYKISTYYFGQNNFALVCNYHPRRGKKWKLFLVGRTSK